MTAAAAPARKAPSARPEIVGLLLLRGVQLQEFRRASHHMDNVTVRKYRLDLLAREAKP